MYRNAWGWNYFTNFVETDDFPTAISSVRTPAGAEDGKAYDLMGRRIASPCKGQVYIKNGKKLIAR